MVKTLPLTVSLPPFTDRGRRRAFTLVELLTVIAVIGILAAILIPVTSKVRASARRTGCASNLRQIGVGIQLYAEEHKNTLPYVYDPNASDENFFWYNTVSLAMGLDHDAWLRTDGVFTCGAADIPVPHYTMSWNVSAKSRASLANPSQTVIVADGPGSSGAGINQSPPFGGIDATRHGDGANYLFVDGHVEFLKTIPADGLIPELVD